MPGPTREELGIARTGFFDLEAARQSARKYKKQVRARRSAQPVLVVVGFGGVAVHLTELGHEVVHPECVGGRFNCSGVPFLAREGLHYVPEVRVDVVVGEQNREPNHEVFQRMQSLFQVSDLRGRVGGADGRSVHGGLSGESPASYNSGAETGNGEGS